MKRVLVIDDEEMVLEVIDMILTDLGCEVRSCRRPQDGIQEALASEYDLVLCDLRMPDINGAEVTQEILKAKPETRILIITAYPSDPLAKKALDFGAVSLLKKPFEVAKILDFLQE